MSSSGKLLVPVIVAPSFHSTSTVGGRGIGGDGGSSGVDGGGDGDGGGGEGGGGGGGDGA